MGVSLLTAGTVLRWGDQAGEVLNLRPYLATPAPAGILAGDLSSVGGFGLALLGGVTGLLLFLVLEALGRHVWRNAHEAAALFPAAVFCALPAQTALHRVEGGESLLLGMAVLLLGCWGCFARTRWLVAFAAALGALSPVFHPGVVALVPAVVACLAAAGVVAGAVRVGGALFGVVLVGVGAMLWGGGAMMAEPVHVSVLDHRLAWSLEILAASPLLATWNQPRDLLPTGFEALMGLWPVVAGLSVWGLLCGWGCLVAGISRAAWAIVLAILAGVIPAHCISGWLPGERGLALLPLLPLTGLITLLLGGIRGSVPRDVLILLSVAVVAVGGWDAVQRESGGVVGHRRTIHQFQETPGLGFIAAAQRDPARLVLYANDLLAYEEDRGRQDPRLGGMHPHRLQAAFEAHRRMTRGTVSALDPEGLAQLALRLAGDQKVLPPVDRDRWESLIGLERRLADVRALSRRGRPDEWYEAVQASLQELLADAYELYHSGNRHPRVLSWLSSYVSLARRAAMVATEIGDLQCAIPLREFLVGIAGDPKAEAKSRAILALDMLDQGQVDQAFDHLRAAVPELPRSEVLGAVARGALARCRLVRGDKEPALKALHAAWSGLALRSQGSNLLEGLAQPASREYWLITELLLARYELVREFDLDLLPQARQDLARALEPALGFGIRRVPALAMAGRLAWLEGDATRARRLLAEMRAISPKSLAERGSGPRGYLDTPKWRLLGLRALMKVLDPSSDADLRQKVEKEIRELDRF